MSAGWASGPLLAVDLEATGVDIETARIVTATAIRLGPGRDPVVSNWLIAPDIDIPAEATAIHGVTTDYAREHGRPAADVLPEVRDAIRSAWAAGAIVLGHNLGGYDLSLIDRECRRWLDTPFGVVGPVADSLALDRGVDRYRRGSRKLEATCEHYGVHLDGAAHNAEVDALASARICWKLANQYPEVAAMSHRELWRYQRAAYREWAMHFQDYKRQQARDAGQSVAEIEAIVIPPDWPLRPLPVGVPS